MAINIDSIADTLKKDIINLDIVPGSKIIEEDLVARFNVSRTPVRTVILRLEADGLLRVAPKKGTYVTKIDFDKVSDQIYIRKSIEKNILKECCEHPEKVDFLQLGEILSEQKRLLSEPGSIERSKAFFHADNAFHKSLFTFMGKEGVWEIIHSEATALNRVRLISNLRGQSQVELVYQQHVDLVNCIKAGDAEKAAEIIEDHITGGLDGIQAVRDKYPEYFK